MEMEGQISGAGFLLLLFMHVTVLVGKVYRTGKSMDQAGCDLLYRR
jgi:hypothetical protein